MNIKEIIELLNTEVYYLPDEQKEMEINSAAASDLMSDILAMVKVPDLLLTGLNNRQVINTCSVFGIKSVILVRGKKIIDDSVLELASEEGINLLSTEFSMYQACGLLYTKGLRSVHELDE